MNTQADLVELADAEIALLVEAYVDVALIKEA